MKNIHLLPTTKKQHSIIQKNSGLLLVQTPNGDYTGTKLNLYITSDELIKDVRPYKGKWQLEQGEILNKFPTYLTDLSECKLVIMTTDQDLINDGVQAIDDEFLGWFIKNPSCKKVEVTKDIIQIDQSNPVTNGSTALVQKYKIIIPQEVPKQETTGKEFYESADKVITVERQETLKEAARKWYNNTKLFDKGELNAFVAGAKWQSENMSIHILDVENTYVHIEDGVIVVEKNDKTKRMYSEEEVFNLCRGFAIFVVQTGASYEKQVQWFEQNKKK